MKDVTIIIGEIVDQMDTTINGTFEIASGKTLFCDTKWARVGKNISDEVGNIYLIEEVETDKWIIATPLVVQIPELFLEGKCFLTPPFWMTGTKLATNREWTIAGDHLDTKLPLIWMLETINETGFGRGSSIEREIELRLFFLDETDPSQYYTVNHRKQVVLPMQKLMHEFIATINRLKIFKTVDEFRFKTFSRFGTEQDNGIFDNILDANLSGVALEMTLTKYKENCKC